MPKTLIRARISAGMTQEGLARRLGIKTQQVQRYEPKNGGLSGLVANISHDSGSCERGSVHVNGGSIVLAAKAG